MNPRTLIVAIGEATGADRVAVEWLRAKASGEADRGSVGLLVDLGRDQPRPASLIAREEAKALERKLEGAVTGFEFRARGDLVHAGGEPERPAAEVEALGAHLEGVPMAVVATPASYRDLLELGSWDEVIIRTAGEPSALVEILAEEAGDFAGEVSFSRAARRRGHLLSRLRSEGGQATPLVLPCRPSARVMITCLGCSPRRDCRTAFRTLLTCQSRFSSHERGRPPSGPLS